MDQDLMLSDGKTEPNPNEFIPLASDPIEDITENPSDICELGWNCVIIYLSAFIFL